MHYTSIAFKNHVQIYLKSVNIKPKKYINAQIHKH